MLYVQVFMTSRQAAEQRVSAVSHPTTNTSSMAESEVHISSSKRRSMYTKFKLRETAREEWTSARRWMSMDRVHILLLRHHAAAVNAKEKHATCTMMEGVFDGLCRALLCYKRAVVRRVSVEGGRDEAAIQTAHPSPCTPSSSLNSTNLEAYLNVPEKDSSSAADQSLWSIVGLDDNEWSTSFRTLVTNVDGRAAFTQFLQSEYADENILYFNAVEQLLAQTGDEDYARYAIDVYNTFVVADAPLEVNISREMRQAIEKGMMTSSSPSSRRLYLPSVKHIYMLMEKDSYTRFRRTAEYRKWASSVTT